MKVRVVLKLYKTIGTYNKFMMPYSKYIRVEVYVILKGKVEAIRGKIYKKQLRNSCYVLLMIMEGRSGVGGGYYWER